MQDSLRWVASRPSVASAPGKPPALGMALKKRISENHWKCHLSQYLLDYLIDKSCIYNCISIMMFCYVYIIYNMICRYLENYINSVSYPSYLNVFWPTVWSFGHLPLSWYLLWRSRILAERLTEPPPRPAIALESSGSVTCKASRHSIAMMCATFGFCARCQHFESWRRASNCKWLFKLLKLFN